jgi:predicted esterase
MAPPAIMLETVKYLESDSGASATIANFQGGHEIDAEALSIMHRWFIAQSTAPLNP